MLTAPGLEGFVGGDRPWRVAKVGRSAGLRDAEDLDMAMVPGTATRSRVGKSYTPRLLIGLLAIDRRD